MKIAQCSSILFLLATNVLSFTAPKQNSPMKSALRASVTQKNLSEWERWRNESVNVNLRPEYRQDDVFLNQELPFNSRRASVGMFSTTKSKLVDDDPWRKVKVDEYTPTGINHQRQYINHDYQNMNGSYSHTYQNAGLGLRNDIRRNIQSANGNNYDVSNNSDVYQNNGYRQEFQNPRYLNDYQSNAEVNSKVAYQQRNQPGQSYRRNRDIQDYQVNREGIQRNGYRNDIYRHHQSVDERNLQTLNQRNENHNYDGYRRQYGNTKENMNRFEKWENDRIKNGVNFNRYSRNSPMIDNYNQGDEYAFSHYNSQRNRRYSMNQTFDQVHNDQTKRFPAYEDSNFDPTSTIYPIQGSNKQHPYQSQSYSTIVQPLGRNGVNYYPNISNSFNHNDRNTHSISNTYQRVNQNKSINSDSIYSKVFQPDETEQSQRSIPVNKQYDFRKQEMKRFPTYESDDDPSCPKETR